MVLAAGMQVETRDVSMESTTALFVPLQAAVARKNQEGGFDANHPWHHQLTVNESDGLLDVEYRGEHALWFDDGTDVAILQDLLRQLASAAVAPRLRSFTYRTEAVLAANGTCECYIDPLGEGEQPFPNLARLVLDQGDGEHGYKILASSDVLTRLLEKAPSLIELTTPGPPAASFFQGPPHRLQSLDVDAGYDHADFIRHLAGCVRFPGLRRVVFTDFRQDYLRDWSKRTTPFEDYVSFFRSAVASRLESISMRQVNVSEDQVQRILEMRRNGVEITTR
jgi:hypothetical protein